MHIEVYTYTHIRIHITTCTNLRVSACACMFAPMCLCLSSGVGKTSLMVKYVEGAFDEVLTQTTNTQAHQRTCSQLSSSHVQAPTIENSRFTPKQDYIETLGVNFMDKTVTIRNENITFSIWDLGRQREFINVRVFAIIIRENV